MHKKKPNWYVNTGGSSTGKTTVINPLTKRDYILMYLNENEAIAF
ncbi:MAG: ATP-binding protein [Bacteroidota bacterium]|nr:ATP-binding protein [Bacteroidota bacterium]